MVANIEKIKEFLEYLLALISSAGRYLKNRWEIILFIVVCLVCVLLCFLASCTTNHYFSVNAEEMTNPKIEYRDSTNLQNPF